MKLPFFSIPIARLKTPAQRFGFAFVITALGLILTLVLSEATEHGVFQVAVVSVVLSAWYGGLYPGLLSALLAAAGIAFAVLVPQYSLAVSKWEDLLQLIVFVSVSLVISSLSEARHRTERLLHTRTTELEEANQELESFSYSVSHDLRWPLRAIDGYSRILLDEYGSRLDPKAQRYLNSMRTSTQQMDRLVEDLLAFSRLGRLSLKKQPVDLAELVRQALGELESLTEGRSVDITVGTLPTTSADPTLLKQVFVNLLQNALKFTRARPHAVIQVGHRGQGPGGIGIYYVQDNGVGFDMKYVEKAFGVFQRLHRPEEYEGTGVGLAIVHRIVSRHGGRVWAEAEVDKGATFYFTLQGDKEDGAGTN
ncbi:MAG TPA: ATP-binding protein [Nitrospiraceae bacterium]|nr:ATP-binding protein [Nitrospiraceae bacterium]